MADDCAMRMPYGHTPHRIRFHNMLFVPHTIISYKLYKLEFEKQKKNRNICIWLIKLDTFPFLQQEKHVNETQKTKK